MSDIVDRITEYLSAGGLFNPELMPADKVRDLVIDSRNTIESLCKRLADEQEARQNTFANLTQECNRLLQIIGVDRARLAEQGDVISQLRFDLAEADALLREARGEIAWSPAIMRTLVARIDAYLSRKPTASPAPGRDPKATSV